MKRFVLFLTFCNVALSQPRYEIVYKQIVNDNKDDYGLNHASFSKLVVYDNVNFIYEKSMDTILVGANGLLIEPLAGDTPAYKLVFKKSPADNVVRYHRNYADGYWTIKDTISFKYIKGKKLKQIAGYQCKQAFTSFRGRHYELYYTEEIPVFEGPFKFMNAPGLILEVRSSDDTVRINAVIVKTDLQEEQNFNTTLAVFDKESNRYLSYSQEVSTYLNHCRQIKLKMESETKGLSTFFPTRFIEIFSEKL